MKNVRDIKAEFKSSPPPPPLSSQKKKELIILLCYFGVGNRSRANAGEDMLRLKLILDKEFDDISEYTNYIVKIIILPTSGSKNELKCIFPKEKDIDLSFLDEIINDQGKNSIITDVPKSKDVKIDEL